MDTIHSCNVSCNVCSSFFQSQSPSRLADGVAKRVMHDSTKKSTCPTKTTADHADNMH